MGSVWQHNEIPWFCQNILFENGVLSSNEKKWLNRLNWDIKLSFLTLPNRQFCFFFDKWRFLESHWDSKRTHSLIIFQLTTKQEKADSNGDSLFHKTKNGSHSLSPTLINRYGHMENLKILYLYIVLPHDPSFSFFLLQFYQWKRWPHCLL